VYKSFDFTLQALSMIDEINVRFLLY